MLATLSRQLDDKLSLADDQIASAVEALIDEKIAATDKADFLGALARKGETVAELAGFARELRARSIVPVLDPAIRGGEILDVCGTGGDHLNTFNISTTVALLCAAAGVVVAKHGNRASTSQTGSADVLEALGIPIDLGPGEAAESLLRHGFAFFFAPRYHPAFRHLAEARKLCAQRGSRTIFNLLGPLLNPARPSAQLVGVPRPGVVEPVARVLQSLGVRRAMVVCGEVPEAGTIRHLDEFSTLGETWVAEFLHERAFTSSRLAPGDMPIGPATLADLRGGNRDDNAAIIRKIFAGEDRGPRRDAVLLNASAALFVAGRAKSMSAGWDLAAATLESGAASTKLRDLSQKSAP